MNTYHPMRVFVIPMRLPGLNEYIDAERTHRQKAAKLKRLVQRDISACILDQLGGAAYDCPVDIEYTWYEADRRRDKDNIAFAKKFINDALVECGVLPNDGWRNIRTMFDMFDVDATNPRVEVTISPCYDEEDFT